MAAAVVVQIVLESGLERQIHPMSVVLLVRPLIATRPQTMCAQLRLHFPDGPPWLMAWLENWKPMQLGAEHAQNEAYAADASSDLLTRIDQTASRVLSGVWVASEADIEVENVVVVVVVVVVVAAVSLWVSFRVFERMGAGGGRMVR